MGSQDCPSSVAVVPCEEILDICLILDSSGSIRDNNPRDGAYDNWNLVRQFVADLMDYFHIGRDRTRVGAVVFSEEVRLVFSLNTYSERRLMQEALMNLHYMGRETNTPEAIRVARQQCFNPTNGDRPEVQNVAIIVTDGVPYPEDRTVEAITQAQVMRAEGTRMVAVGITQIIDRSLLKQLSSPPQIEDENYFTSADFTALGEINQLVGKLSCVQPTEGEFLSFSVTLTALASIVQYEFHQSAK